MGNGSDVRAVTHGMRGVAGAGQAETGHGEKQPGMAALANKTKTGRWQRRFWASPTAYAKEETHGICTAELKLETQASRIVQP